MRRILALSSALSTGHFSNIRLAARQQRREEERGWRACLEALAGHPVGEEFQFIQA